jgi:hypothetical protein
MTTIEPWAELGQTKEQFISFPSQRRSSRFSARMSLTSSIRCASEIAATIASYRTRRLWHLTYPLIASANPAHVTHAFLAMLAYGLPLWA